MTDPAPDAEPADAVVVSDEPVAKEDAPWLRLHSRMIWVDIVQTLLSLTPAALALTVFGLEWSFGALWPVLLVAVFGVVGAVADAMRWIFTRYRITDTYVERRTGVFVRQYRSVRRDRIRSVDIDAKLRHRLSGLRVVQVGAGQQMAAMESALKLDAVLRADAEELRHLLTKRSPAARVQGEDASVTAPGLTSPASDEPDVDEPEAHVFATLQSRWVLYNMFSIWAYLTAAGLLWGAYWLLVMFNVDPGAWVETALNWEQLGMGWSFLIAFGALTVVGVTGMAITFFTTHWKFELARIPGAKGTLLRTRQGLFRTREVNREDARMRGIHLSEPVLWRWMGMTDTNVITTGLSFMAAIQPSTILPRGPMSVARPVADLVLDADPSPLDAPLTPHPPRALLRRLWWATSVAVVGTGVIGLFVVNGQVTATWLWAGAGLWAVSLLAAVVAYRALGHGIAGKYLVIRSGLMNRGTAVLERSAVSTIAVRQSLLQRRLGLKTVSAMSAAGYGMYQAPDIQADDAVQFAIDAAPGLLEQFVVEGGR